MSDITVTGSTYGDASHIVVYYDVTTKNLYDSNGNLFGNNILTTFLDNNFILEIHYVQNVDSGYNPEEWEVWDGLEGATVDSSLSFDNDYLHAHKGTLLTTIIEGSTVASINVPDISKDTINDSGTLVFNPFDPDNKKVVKYSDVEYITGSTYSYTLDGGDVTDAIAEGSEVRVEDPMYLYVDSNAIYEANIQPQYDKGIFKFPVHALSRKLLNALDYTSTAGVGGTMEHKIFVKKQSLIGISISDVTYTRNSQKDAVVQDVYGPCLFCYWSKDDDGYWTKGNDIVEGTPIYIVEEGSATLQSDTANPVLSIDSVLFRTFTFPFVVQNLVDYNFSINIPTKDVNWGKEYVLSIIAESFPGAVPFNENEFTVSDKVYINSIAQGKITGLSDALDAKLEFISD